MLGSNVEHTAFGPTSEEVLPQQNPKTWLWNEAGGFEEIKAQSALKLIKGLPIKLSRSHGKSLPGLDYRLPLMSWFSRPSVSSITLMETMLSEAQRRGPC